MSETSNAVTQPPSWAGFAWGAVFTSTVVSLVSWVVAAGAVSLLWFAGPVLQGFGSMGTLPVMGLIAGLIVGLCSRSKRVLVGGIVAGTVGMVVAFVPTFIIMFAVFHNDALGWLGTIAFLVIVTTIFCPIYGAATINARAAGLFALVAVIVAIPLAVLLQAVLDGASDTSAIVWLSMLEAVTIGLATGLATGIHQARAVPSRRSGARPARH